MRYPYLPEGHNILYVPGNNPFMQEAKEYSRVHSLDRKVPTGAVVVGGGVVIGRGANGSDYHQSHECERVKRGIPTGQGYELCEGCHPKNHSEPRAIADALSQGHETEGADLYLWGHWWACEPCWKAIMSAGISRVYLQEGSERLYNREHPESIVGQEFI